MRPGRRSGSVVVLSVVLLLVVMAAAGCEETPQSVPTASEVESYYTYRGELEASVEGGTVEIRATQPSEQLQRGGTLWAKVGPYIILFSEETRRLFQEHEGVSAVRVVTTTPDGGEVARAYLPREAMTGLMWNRALNIAGEARQSGTERPALLEDLVRWGEDHTDFSYAPEYQDQAESERGRERR